MTFKRSYDKYLVLKWDDINRLLNAEAKKRLQSICSAIDEVREYEGKKDNRYVVVNEDEPYAEEVWDLIEQHEAFEKVRAKIQADPELSDFWERFCYFIE